MNTDLNGHVVNCANTWMKWCHYGVHCTTGEFSCVYCHVAVLSALCGIAKLHNIYLSHACTAHSSDCLVLEQIISQLVGFANHCACTYVCAYVRSWSQVNCFLSWIIIIMKLCSYIVISSIVLLSLLLTLRYVSLCLNRLRFYSSNECNVII